MSAGLVWSGTSALVLPLRGRLPRRLQPDVHTATIGLTHLESAGLAHQIAQLRRAVGARVEVGEELVKLLTDAAEMHPAVLIVHLVDGLAQQRDRRARRLQRLGFRRPLAPGRRR